MLKYIGGIEAYDFFINLGSVIGSILLIVLYYRKNRSWKKTAEVYLLAFAILEVGMFAGRLVRGLSYWEEWNIFHIITQLNGNHFIGRVLFTMWVFPVLYRAIFRKEKGEWTGYLDLLCVFLAFQHIFNRIACLCEGCCMGKPYSGIFAFWYRANGKSGAGFSYPVWPVQIFEISGMVILLILFFALHTKKKHFADVFSMGFAVCIFLSEFMMDQTGVLLIAGLSVIQYAAIVLFVTGIFIHRCFKSRQR